MNLSFKEAFSYSLQKENINKTRICTPKSKEEIKQSPTTLVAGHKRTRSHLSPKAADVQQVANRLKT